MVGERLTSSQKLVDQGEKGVYSSYTQLTDPLQEALVACRKIKSHEAHRRQMQYIGKLMRDVDLAPIQQQLAQVKHSGQVATAKLHQIEHWRERLLREGNTALDELLQTYPGADAAQLQQMLANAKKEAEHHQPPRAARKLFKYLREMLVD